MEQAGAHDTRRVSDTGGSGRVRYRVPTQERDLFQSTASESVGRTARSLTDYGRRRTVSAVVVRPSAQNTAKGWPENGVLQTPVEWQLTNIQDG